MYFTLPVVPLGDYYVSMWAQTHPGATCYAHVVYSTGYRLPSIQWCSKR